MRTTVTLDPDVERLLRKAVRDRGVSRKEALNEAVRAGLTRSRGQRRRPFVQKSYSLGSEQLFRWDRALRAADAVEDQERSRRLSERK